MLFSGPRWGGGRVGTLPPASARGRVGGARGLNAGHQALLELQLQEELAVLNQRLARRIHFCLFDAVPCAYINGQYTILVQYIQSMRAN